MCCSFYSISIVCIKHIYIYWILNDEKHLKKIHNSRTRAFAYLLQEVSLKTELLSAEMRKNSWTTNEATGDWWKKIHEDIYIQTNTLSFHHFIMFFFEIRTSEHIHSTHHVAWLCLRRCNRNESACMLNKLT